MSTSAVRTRSYQSWSVAVARGPCGSARHTWRRRRSPASPAPPPSPQSAPPSTQNNQMESNKQGKEGVTICCIHQLLLFNARFFFKKREDISPFGGATDTLVLDFWWCLPWFSKPGWIPLLACFTACAQWNPQNHLWCGICWSLGDQHGSWAIVIHLLANKH